MIDCFCNYFNLPIRCNKLFWQDNFKIAFFKKVLFTVLKLDYPEGFRTLHTNILSLCQVLNLAHWHRSDRFPDFSFVFTANYANSQALSHTSPPQKGLCLVSSSSKELGTLIAFGSHSSECLTEVSKPFALLCPLWYWQGAMSTFQAKFYRTTSNRHIFIIKAIA